MLIDEDAAAAAVDAADRHLDSDDLLRVLARVPRRRWVAVRRNADRIRHEHGLPLGRQEALFPELSRREREVLALLAEGCHNDEIAKRLTISPATVKTHVHRVLVRLGVADRLEAALLYRERVAES
jgi:DNA-binding NarL/FixJ family response regulator